MEHRDQRRRSGRQDPSRTPDARRGYESDDERDTGERYFGDESYDQERASRARREERGGERTSSRERGESRDERHSRAGQSERRGSEDSAFSPDWSRDEAQPMYSDDPYYLRNREYQGRTDESARHYGIGRDQGGDRQREHGGSRGRLGQESEWRGREADWRGDENRRTTAEQRERGFTPRGENDGDWSRGTGRGLYGSDDRDTHYRGYYRQSVTPYSYPGGRGALVMESWTIAGPYTGRGPKGYKRSNENFVEEASQRLERDGQVDASEIEVTAEDGVITLRGTVPDRAMKRRAEECVESIYGVHDVANELRVSRQGSEQSRGEQGRSSRSTRASSSASSGSTTTEPSDDDKKSQKDKQH
jgi:BON domain-containing protein